MLKFKSVRQQILVSGIIFAVLAMLFGMWSAHNSEKPKTNPRIALQNGTVFPIPRTISAFNLTDSNGHAFTNERLKGHWTMLFFGFTNCAVLCPTTLSTLNQTQQLLHKAKIVAMPQVVFVSIDPERDTVKRINAYVHSFNPDFMGATSQKPQLDKLTKELNILYMKVVDTNTKENKNYQIDHSGTVLLVNPQGELQALFSPPIEAKVLAEDYQTILKNTPTE